MNLFGGPCPVSITLKVHTRVYLDRWQWSIEVRDSTTNDLLALSVRPLLARESLGPELAKMLLACQNAVSVSEGSSGAESLLDLRLSEDGASE